MRTHVLLAFLLVMCLNLQGVFHKIGYYQPQPPDYYGLVVATGNTACLSLDENGLQLLDISDPSLPTLCSALPTVRNARCLAVEGNTIYALGYISTLPSSRIIVIDISNPFQPLIRGSSIASPYAKGMSVVNGIACVVWGVSIDGFPYSGYELYDVSNPDNPWLIDSQELNSSPNDVIISGNKIFIADENGLKIYDITSPQNPILEGSYQVQYGIDFVHVDEEIAYLGKYDLFVLDVSVPANPVLLNRFPAYGGKIAFHGERLCVGNDECLREFDVSNPQNPITVGVYGYYANNFYISGDLAFTFSGQDLCLIDISSVYNPCLLGALDTPGSASSVVTEGNVAYVADGSNGLLKIDISDPTAPQLLGSCPTFACLNQLVKNGDLVYASCGSWMAWTGLQVFDVSGVLPVLLSSLELEDTPKTIVVAEEVVYAIIDSYGLKMIDVSDPAQPMLIGSYGNPGSTFCSLAVSGNRVYLSGRYFLKVLNLTNPQQPVLIGEYSDLDFAVSIAVSGNVVYVVDYYPGVVIIDFSDPANPGQIGSIETNTNSFYSLCQVDGNKLFLTDSYWSEIGIYDIMIPLSPVLISKYRFNHDTSGIAKSGSVLCTANGRPGGVMFHNFTMMDSDDESTPPVSGLSLGNYPNPFNPSTTIRFTLPDHARVNLNVYNARGQLVRILLAQNLSSGQHQVVWSGIDQYGERVSSGLYVVRLSAGNETLLRKILLIK